MRRWLPILTVLAVLAAAGSVYPYVSIFMRTVLDDETQGAARTTLGVGEGDDPCFAGLYVGDDANYVAIGSTGTLSLLGTSGIAIPHLMQSDNTDQVIADVTTDQVITFATDVHHEGITRTSSSRFTIAREGSYLVTFSAVCVGASGKLLAIWMKKNGTNVTESATYYQFKSTGNVAIMTVTFIYHFAVNDFFEFWIWGDSVSNKLDAIAEVAYAEGVTPAIPACPSIIMTCNYIGVD